MNIVIHAKYSGLLITDPEKFKLNVTRGVNAALVQGAAYALSEIQKATPVGATANLRRGWRMDVKGNPDSGNMVEVTVTNPTQYLGTVELGRKAGPVSKEGVLSLQLWVQRKLGIGDVKKSLSIAYAIAANKKKKATPGQAFVQKTVDRVVPEVVSKVIGPAVQKALEELS